jgi:hypothetical protein
MASLPVPGEQYFRDFAFDAVDYDVERDGAVIASVRGLSNSDHGRPYIHIPLGSDVRPGDTLVAGASRFNIRTVEIDTYNGEPSLLKALP